MWCSLWLVLSPGYSWAADSRRPWVPATSSARSEDSNAWRGSWFSGGWSIYLGLVSCSFGLSLAYTNSHLLVKPSSFHSHSRFRSRLRLPRWEPRLCRRSRPRRVRSWGWYRCFELAHAALVRLSRLKREKLSLCYESFVWRTSLLAVRFPLVGTGSGWCRFGPRFYSSSWQHSKTDSWST